MGECAYCPLPATTIEPRSGERVCRVHFEMMAGALTWDKTYTSDEEILNMYSEVPFTEEEREIWERKVKAKYGTK